MKNKEGLSQILIVSITPYFLEREVIWFKENLQEIIASAKTQPFFKENILFLKEGEAHHLSLLLRKLDEMGYEKVFSVDNPGEFSQKGGIVEVFPINENQAMRLDFLGNKIERIEGLAIEIQDEKRAREILQKKLTSQKLFSDIKNAKPGDYLVHLDHGVGKLIGIQRLHGQTLDHEYYAIAYANQDVLYVPLGLERKLSRYVGFADPTISRLGSMVWQKTKRRIKEEVERLAKELLGLYAEKEIVTRNPYVVDKELESQLNAGFFFQETRDQILTLEDIKKDLGKEKPMDRIVCGDVGFGKTEIAIRASFLAVMNGYQTAIICPTTILAKQHFSNFKKRFEKLPVRISLLSRLQTKKEQHNIIAKLKEGAIDIVVGTHRILSGDVAFKNLQLLVIDDEQRFGVKQKEKLRQKNPALDILSLSATPIPRTLYLALSSFKNISFIKTPPEGRKAINTIIMPYDKNMIEKAITKELQRKGQVYFLHNRVSSIEHIKDVLKKLVPDAEFSFIHGRMPEKKLIQTMDVFQKGETDVLVATTIIENGIDLPKVNTIIIEDASRLGLSQAYQIKGRVGRSNVESYAYFFHPQNLTDLAKKRLKALRKAKALGSGYHVAIRDLELRGAGNILGKEQSGSINKIGLNLYCQMLAESVEKLKR